jgi:PTH1 family peptidyl-tRNA hydrolase
MAIRLVVGLGNVGAKYELTRHNLGSRVLRSWAKRVDAGEWERQEKYPAEMLRIDARKAAMFPLTMMNNSGQAVAKFSRENGLTADEVLIVYDEVELAPGRVKLQQGGSAKGHRGVKSVIRALGTDSFWRLRLGVGRPPENKDLDEFVLQRFSSEEERAIVPELIEAASKQLTVLRSVGTQDN